MFVAGGSVSLANSTFFANTANNGGAGGVASLGGATEVTRRLAPCSSPVAAWISSG